MPRSRQKRTAAIQLRKGRDLWVLKDELVHFEGFYEVPIDQIRDAKVDKVLRALSKEVLEPYRIQPGRRPDIFLQKDDAF
jgi:hypothetical protein